MKIYLILTTGLFLLYWIMPRKYLGWLFALFVLAMSVMAFHVEPNPTDDLARYFQQIRNLKTGGLDYLTDCIRDNVHGWGNAPVNGLYYYLISRLPDEHYLPAVTIFLAYGAMFHMLWLAAKRFEVGRADLFAACFFLVSTYWYYDICSGIRNGLAFTLFGYFLYLELVERRHVRLCWLGYLLMVGIHTSVLLLLLLRVCLLLSGRRQRYASLFSPLVLAALLFGVPLLEVLSRVVQSSYLQSLLDKAEAYESGTGLAILLDAGAMYYSNIATFIVCALLIAFFGKVVMESAQRERFRQYCVFLRYLLCLMLGAVTTSMVFLRLARWLLPQLTVILFLAGARMYRARDDAAQSGGVVTVIRSKRAHLRGKNQRMIFYLTLLYSALHYAYSLIGSSLIWLHFSA